MTIPATPATEPVADAPDGALEPTPVQSEGAGLRAQLEASLAENRALKAEKRDGIIEGLGLDTETGMGKMLAERFDAGDLTLDNLEQTAIEGYGVVKPEAIDQNPAAPEIHQQQAALDQVTAQAGSVSPETQADLLAKAEAEGDTRTSLLLKAQQITDMQ